MRAICKDCTLSKVCNGVCPETKAYDSGYNAAIEKACEWLKANTYSFRSDELLEQFVEAMKGE